MLITIRNETGHKVTDYRCPVLERPQLNLTTQLRNKYIRFRPSTQKFAETHHFNIPNVQSAFEDLNTYGCGKHMYPADLSAFKEEVIRICEDERASWIFKRTIADPGMDILEDEDTLEL